MRQMFKGLVVGLLVLVGQVGVQAAGVTVGDPAPEFVLADSSNKMRSLSEFRGKFVVLEWVNPECPFVQKHYNKSGNMPKLQQWAASQGVVWLSINSSASGKQGHLELDTAGAWKAQVHSAATAILLDPDGKVGRQYDAKTTPQVFLINPEGKVLYNGAIDNVPSTDPADINGAHNYVRSAIEEAMTGKPVSVATSQPYGCSVKY